MSTLGIIRVLTTTDPILLHEHGKQIEDKFQIKTISACIPDQPNGIHDDETEKTAIPKIIQLARHLVEKDKVSVIAISCAADPGLAEVRKAVSVPVIGAGSTGAFNALMFSKNVGIIGITKEAPISIKNIVGRHLVGYESIEGVTRTNDLFQSNSVQRACQSIQKLLDKGAKAILFACTGFSTIELAAEARKCFKVPIIDLVEAQGIASLSLLSQEGRV
ncbi:aspartate/glutamate racemase family protein [Pseudalkalibacillus sp. A8]|uniref:aspartate/glutamate racemase family protein n=1 Tax=Pseudalkalibacillus sp. A8 TaxID=3382641 RepID=UPI0038B4382A